MASRSKETYRDLKRPEQFRDCDPDLTKGVSMIIATVSAEVSLRQE
ncbi:hypothetical protein HSB1_40290 [Halogranum salarium B-1]|uniref:Uncharacterized protein n=1 Tax=Halogranum salarium B-1 TaxID=1210908 RepID=J2ZXE4_9EURY|nr:hypothetical protein HSB1_40290 [Halogranum salarium B-1]